MTGRMRRVYQGLAWLFIGAVLAQVFFAGLALFAGTGFELHAVYGGTAVYLISLLLIPAAWLAGAGRGSVWKSVLLFVVVTVQVSLPGLREALPILAAVHPMNALLIFWLGLHLARRARELRRAPLPLITSSEPALTQPWVTARGPR